MASTSWTTAIPVLVSALALLCFCGLALAPVSVTSAEHQLRPAPSAAVTLNDPVVTFVSQLMDQFKHMMENPKFDFDGLLTVVRSMRKIFSPFFKESASLAAKNCDDMGIHVDADAIENELIANFQNSFALMIQMCIQLELKMSPRYSQQVAREIGNLLTKWSPIREPLDLKSHHKKLLTEAFLRPFCSFMTDLGNEMANPKYENLARAKTCEPIDESSDSLSQIVEQLFELPLKDDICRNDGAWIFDLLDAHPLRCPAELWAAWIASGIEGRMQQHQKHAQDVFEASVGVGGDGDPNSALELDFNALLCNATETLAEAASILLMTPCDGDDDLNLSLGQVPIPAQILLHTFKDTIDFWRGICSGRPHLSVNV